MIQLVGSTSFAHVCDERRFKGSNSSVKFCFAASRKMYELGVRCWASLASPTSSSESAQEESSSYSKELKLRRPHPIDNARSETTMRELAEPVARWRAAEIAQERWPNAPDSPAVSEGRCLDGSEGCRVIGSPIAQLSIQVEQICDSSTPESQEEYLSSIHPSTSTPTGHRDSDMKQKPCRSQPDIVGAQRHRKEAAFRDQAGLCSVSGRCGPVVDEILTSLRGTGTRTIDRGLEESNLSREDSSCLLKELQQCHDWQNALKLFRWLKRQPWHYPSSRLYTRLIGFFGREGQVNLASLLFQEMLLEKCKPDHYTFTAMLDAYGRARMFDKALEVFSHMKESGQPECRPSSVTCNALLDCLVKGGLYEQALETFSDMRESKNGLGAACKPNVVTYNVLIDALCKEGHVERAVRVLHHMSNGDLDLKYRQMCL